MKTFWCFLLFAPLFAVTVAKAQMSTHMEEARVLALESAWNQAIQLKDAKALAPLFIDDLVYIDDDGRMMNKAEYLISVAEPSRRPEHVVSEAMQAHSYGNTVVVTGIYRENGTRKGRAYALRERFSDTWVRRNGEWRCIASQSTLILP